MNLKRRLLLSTSIPLLTIAVISSLAYLNPSQASSTSTQKTDMTAQTPSIELSQDSSRRTTRRDLIPIGKSTYTLEEPAIQFDYDPNRLVLSSFEAEGLDDQSLLLRSLDLWSKRDYVSLKNAGDELGDFPNKLRIAVYANPDGIPALDW